MTVTEQEGCPVCGKEAPPGLYLPFCGREHWQSSRKARLFKGLMPTGTEGDARAAIRGSRAGGFR